MIVGGLVGPRKPPIASELVPVSVFVWPVDWPFCAVAVGAVWEAEIPAGVTVTASRAMRAA